VTKGGPRRVGVLVRKEFLQLARDPRMRRVLFLLPVIQLIVFGYAVSTDIRHTETFVVDLDGTPEARRLIEVFESSGYFDVVERSRRPGDLVRALDHGDAVLGVVVSAGYADDLSRHEATVQLLVDGTNSNVATVVLGYAERIVHGHGIAVAGGGIAPPIELRDRAWFNPDLDSRDYNVPAVVGVLILVVCFMLTALAIVREREIGTLEQLMVSPLSPLELVMGKAIPFALIGLFDLAVVTVIAVLWFRVPFAGSPLLLFGSSLLFLLSGLGLGLFVSTITRTQQEAFMASYLLFFPMILLSGFMFPVSSMPAVFRWISLANPLRHFLEIVRGIFLKGVGLPELWTQHVALAILGVGLLAVAAWRFEKRVG